MDGDIMTIKIITYKKEVENLFVELSREWHSVKSITDNGLIFTDCGISTWQEFRNTTNKKRITCERCQSVKYVTIKDNIVLWNNEILYEAKDAKDARTWCRTYGALAFGIKDGIVSARIFYSGEEDENLSSHH